MVVVFDYTGRLYQIEGKALPMATVTNRSPSTTPIYLLVNPFPPVPRNGVNSYYQSALSSLSGHFNICGFSNLTDEGLGEFRETLARYLAANFSRDDVIIEAPDTRAATLGLFGWKVHVRLHCPMRVAQKYAQLDIDEARFSDELHAIKMASVVSSPSHAMIDDQSFL